MVRIVRLRTVGDAGPYDGCGTSVAVRIVRGDSLREDDILPYGGWGTNVAVGWCGMLFAHSPSPATRELPPGASLYKSFVHHYPWGWCDELVFPLRHEHIRFAKCGDTSPKGRGI